MKLSASTRWVIVFAVVLIALVVAIWPRSSSAPTDALSDPTPSSTQVDPSALAQARIRAALAPCPSPSPSAVGAGPLADLSAPCLSDGRSVNLGAVLAGKPALLNLWAYWCQPCIRELPAMAQFAADARGAITVLTVHRDPNSDQALDLLSSLKVHLPGVEDPQSKIAAALSVPNVYPATVLLRADGSVAKVLLEAFTSASQISSAVRENLGVDVK